MSFSSSSSVSKVRIIIADDHRMIIDGLKLLLHTDPGIEVVGEASNGQEVLGLLHNVEADLVLMDIQMPEMSGIEATWKVKEQYPHVKVIMLTMYNKREYITELLEIGASGYLLKNTGKDELFDAIKRVMSGGEYFSSEVTRTILRSKEQETDQDEDHLALISKREREVLKQIAQGLTSKDIAEVLFISQHTVDTHRKNLLRKTDSKNTADLVKFALKNNLID